MRQQTRLLEHRDGRGAQIVERARETGCLQPLRGLRPAFLRPVAESEQRLLAADSGPLRRNVDDLVDAEVRRRHTAWRGRERAVVAAVTAQPGQWNEDLAAVGD